ncbi:hypothetical protein E6O75_ATG11295 [Venturia nashicola]|uniref:Uncharacterized protein n=1 Tax=Venturia nashicola TaxID=86259 RepID=A0A4Z1NXP7_9PEZI|nr:hypothetical protein E6O75_ATG11295 [Venturia nashicola]
MTTCWPIIENIILSTGWHRQSRGRGNADFYIWSLLPEPEGSPEGFGRCVDSQHCHRSANGAVLYAWWRKTFSWRRAL